MRRRLVDEGGVTLVELVIVMLVLGLIVGGLSNIFVSGMRAGSDTSARTAGQGAIQTAVNRLEFELRCSSGATVPVAGSANASVTVSLRSECVHTTAGEYTWCISGGALLRYSGESCSGSGQTLASDVTTATPFTLLSVSGRLPQLQIDLGVNAGGRSSDAVSITETITLRNAARA